MTFKNLSKSGKVFIHASVLFVLGVCFCLGLNLLQRRRGGGLFDTDLKLLSIFPSTIWIPISCGVAAAVIGMLYPCIDYKLGQFNVYDREWSSVIRCVALFVGINHATAKIDFTSQSQLSFSLAAMSIGLWWFFDRSGSGLALAITIATFATVCSRLIAYIGYYSFTDPAMGYWMPCIFFSGGVTVGLVGRQLAKSDILESVKSKID